MKATVSISCFLVLLWAAQSFSAEAEAEAEQRRHAEEAGMFSFIPPDSWEGRIDANERYTVFYAPNRSGENLAFVELQSVDTVENEVDRNERMLRINALGANLMIPVKTTFTTSDGWQGFRLVFEQKTQEGLHVRQNLFFLPKRKSGEFLLAVCSARAAGGEKFDSVFEESIRSFRFESVPGGLDQKASDRGFCAVFPCPQPMQLYRVKFETEDIDTNGITGWKYWLPVYGDDEFAVFCADRRVPALRGRSDMELIRILCSHLGDIDLQPTARRIGVAQTDGLEFTIIFENGSLERFACARIGDRFFILRALCMDSQPGLHPDPFARDFVNSPEVDKFFDTFELLEEKPEAKEQAAEAAPDRPADTPAATPNRNSRKPDRTNKNRNRNRREPANQGGGFF